MSRLFIAVQYLLPHQAFSRLVAWFMGRRLYKNLLIRFFIRRYGVDLSEAEYSQPEDYADFNAFFTRRLKIGARPLAEDKQRIISPVDGAISQLGRIVQDQIFQAKGHHYSSHALLAGSAEQAARYDNGQFATIYLAPRDYHRIHMPLSGSLRRMRYVPGRLFSVNPITAASVPGLFARNERLVCEFDTELGSMAVILVGAMIVAGIETVWSGPVCPGPRAGKLFEKDYGSGEASVHLQRGEELGLFKTGSTVILLFESQRLQFESHWQAESMIRMGQSLASRLAEQTPNKHGPDQGY
jgi:phosphatidylserine decarboxylase